MQAQASTWKECVEYVRKTWWTIVEALLRSTKEQENSELAPTIAPELAEIATRFWMIEGRLFLTKFKILEKNRETKGVTIAIREGNGIKHPSILITPSALQSKKELIETLLHELLHVAGFISNNKEMDELEVETVLESLLPTLMKQAPITELPDPPCCETSDYMKEPGEKELVIYLSNNPDKALAINMQPVSELIDDIRDPKKWEEGLTKKMEELGETINKIINLHKALRMIYNKKPVFEINDRELRERLKTLVAGGIDPNNPQSHNALAPLLWELFGITIRSVVDNSILNSSSGESLKNYVDFLKNHGINRIYLEIDEPVSSRATLTTFAIRLSLVIEDYFSRINKDKSSTYRTIMDKSPEDPKNIIIEYIPKPGDRPDKLFSLIGELFLRLYSILPGINPYTTFALAFSPAYLSDLLNILKISIHKLTYIELERLREIIKNIGYNITILPDIIGGRKDVDYIINRLASDSTISEVADAIILMHILDDAYHEFPWPIELTLAILSKDEEKIEQLFFTMNNAIVYSPRNLVIGYLLKSLEKSIRSITALPNNEESRSIVCSGYLELRRAGKTFPNSREILRPLLGIPRRLMYSPGFIIYLHRGIVSHSYNGTVRFSVSIDRVSIPGEKNILSRVCRGIEHGR